MPDPSQLKLSKPILYTATDLRQNPSLATKLTAFINKVFASKIRDPEKWDTSPDFKRFGSLDELFDMLGTEGIFCVIFEETASSKTESTIRPGVENNMKIVAGAGVIPWVGGYGYGPNDLGEQGWEMKTVAVDQDAKYMGKGLAVSVMSCLQEYLVRRKIEEVGTQRVGVKDRTLTFWIIMAECVNGVYWRKRGYTDVRKRVAGPGDWGSKSEFEMVVLKKDVVFEGERSMI